MIRYNLRCANDCRFEAWFSDSADFDQQNEHNLVSCPRCESTEVEKEIVAPQIASGHRGSESEDFQEKQTFLSNDEEFAKARALRQALQSLRKHVEEHADHVGDFFAEEARQIHYGKGKKRAIYGRAEEEEAQELRREGIEVQEIPWIPLEDI